jgi:allophanate hydrolase
LEVWALPMATVGSFIAGIPAPLGIGRIELETGETVAGFLCEDFATKAATDISAHGGWRTFLALEKQ